MNLIENTKKTESIIKLYRKNSCKIVLAHGTFDLGLERHAFQISFNVLNYTWNKAKKIIKEKINE